MSSLLFKQGGYMNVYVGDNVHMFRYWYRQPPTVIESEKNRDGSMCGSVLYTSHAELAIRLDTLLSDPEFRYGEYMNWSRNHSYQRFYKLAELFFP